jgi:hypothetical protein
MQDSRPTSADEAAMKDSESIHDDKSIKSEIEIDIKMEKAPPIPPVPQKARLSRPSSTRLSRPNSTHLSLPSSSRPTSRRQSLLQQVLTKQPTSSQKREWRASEESRIIRRLGGPWSQLPSPTESTFSYTHTDASSPARSTFSEYTVISVGTGLSIVQPPSIRNTLHEGSGWTPEIEWDLASPRRFLSLKKKSLSIVKEGAGVD